MSDPNRKDFQKALRRRYIEVSRQINEKILRLWFFGEKEDKMSETQIPASVIPELVKWLSDKVVSPGAYDKYGHNLFFPGAYGTIEELVTAALEAFNARGES